MSPNKLPRRELFLLLMPLVAIGGFVGQAWWREERQRQEEIDRSVQTDVRYKFAPPLALREFSADEAQRRRMNLETLRFTFRASLQEEVEASLREAIERGVFVPVTSESAGPAPDPANDPDDDGPK